MKHEIGSCDILCTFRACYTVIAFVCGDVTDCCFFLFEVLHLFSVYFDLNIGCLIIGILKYEEHGHDNKDPQTRIGHLEPAYQNLTIGTHLKKEKRATTQK